MQKTRLNLLLDQSVTKIDLFFINPWRRIALILISLLLGIVMGGTITTTAGQSAVLDFIVAFSLIIFTEAISFFIYSRKKEKQNGDHKNSLILSVLNFFKIGLTFGLYFEAVKLAT